VPQLTLGPGPHTLTTARGKDVGWLLDRLVLASGTADAPVVARDGLVTQVGAPAPPGPRIDVVHSGRTAVRVHVTGATQPFWMVLGQSHSPGWHAHVVGGRGLGKSQLVDGYANGWLVNPTKEAFDIAMEWTPQKQVWAALWISLLAAIVCLVIVALTMRRRGALASITAPATADADAAIAWSPGPPAGRRARWIAPLLAGALAAIAVAPWVGVLVALLIALVGWKPRLRMYVLVLPATILLLCGIYIALQQSRHVYPSVFEWPTLFPRARTPAWIAVMLLAGDAIAEAFGARASRPPETDA
jgi:hypothetical protein